MQQPLQTFFLPVMKYSELIDMCIEIKKTWNPVVESLDSHAENFLKKVCNWRLSQLTFIKVTDENEKVFVKQVFFGTYRYEEFIKVRPL